MGEKISSYQKLKNEIEDLKSCVSVLNSDIRTIIKSPDSVEGMRIVQMYNIRYDMEDQIWFGDSLVSEITGK